MGVEPGQIWQVPNNPGLWHTVHIYDVKESIIRWYWPDEPTNIRMMPLESFTKIIASDGFVLVNPPFDPELLWE